MKYFFFLIALTFSSGVLAQSTISLTFDDGATNDMPGYKFEQWNKMILDHLEAANVKAIFFVTGSNKLDKKGRFLLKSWNDKGHSLGNHTYSHPNYNNKEMTFEKYKAQFIGTDTIISKYSNYVKMFRFPYLKEGDTREKIDAFRGVLKDNGYRNGHVTIDASDWYITGRLQKRLQENPKADIEGFRKFYLGHLYEKALYYDDLGFKLTGRRIHHTLLLHHNLASALFVGDLVKMFREKGWTVIDAKEAFKDEVFLKNPSNVPAGESLLWALAKESGKFNDVIRYPAEDSQYEKEKMDKLGL